MDEFVQSHFFSDVNHFVRYIKIKWALLAAVEWWMAWRCDGKQFWSWVEIPTRMLSLIFVRIHTNEFIQLLYKSCSTNSYTVWFLYQFVHVFIRIV